MARWPAIAAVGEAIAGLLRDASRRQPPGPFETSQFLLVPPRELLKSPPTDGASIYLYRTEASGLGRGRAPRVGPDGRRFRPSLFLDLHYLLSVWGESAARQHMLLGWCMRVLDDATTLPSGVLNHYLGGDTFGPTEAVEVYLEPLSLQDLANIWDPFNPTQQLSVGYVARGVALDSEEALSDGRPVVERELVYGTVVSSR